MIFLNFSPIKSPAQPPEEDRPKHAKSRNLTDYGCRRWVVLFQKILESASAEDDEIKILVIIYQLEQRMDVNQRICVGSLKT